MQTVRCFLIERDGDGWIRPDTGERFTNATIPAGALWRATWYEDRPEWRGIDGQSWCCQLPGGGTWMIDGRASNCTLPNDNVHKCWCRHGAAPLFTIDKNGTTCDAGAGSIIAPNGWHGFLRNGVLAP